MKILELEQGSQEWLDARREHFTASEAPAMMGCSKYMSRNQLLDVKKGAVPSPISPKQQQLFDKGHAAEAAARDIVEWDTMDDLPPVVGSIEVGGLKLLASFDGLKDATPGELVWEHKLYNQTLAENIRNNVIEPFYYWQLEHQMLVSGSTEALFQCSDGTEENSESMFYCSVPERRQQLIDGWKQFAVDLENHELTAKVEKVEASEMATLPSITYEMNGLAINSNLDVFKEAADRMVSDSKKPLESDQDFADAEVRVKEFKKAEDKIKAVSTAVLSEVESIDKFTKDLAYIGEQLRQARLETNKQVKVRKEEIKRQITLESKQDVNELLQNLNIELAITLPYDTGSIDEAIKNKRTIESIKDAAQTAAALLKADLNKLAASVRKNKAFLELGSIAEYSFLFSDWQQIAYKEHSDFQNLVKSRIADHKEAKAKRLEEERKRMEAEAKAKAEREAQAKVEQERERIRQEELVKLKAEQDAKREAERIEREEIEKAAQAERTKQAALAPTPVEQKAPAEVVKDSPLEPVQLLKSEAFEALQDAVSKLHKWACELPVGEEREKAFAIYQAARLAPLAE